jgi:hypothetical protein
MNAYLVEINKYINTQARMTRLETNFPVAAESRVEDGSVFAPAPNRKHENHRTKVIGNREGNEAVKGQKEELDRYNEKRRCAIFLSLLRE